MYNMYPNYAENTPPPEKPTELTFRASQAELTKWGMDELSSEDQHQARNVAKAERVAASEPVVPSRAAERAVGYVCVNPMVAE